MSDQIYTDLLNQNNNPSTTPNTYKMVVVSGIPIFPGQTIHFDLQKDKSMLALERAYDLKENVFIVLQKHLKTQKPAPKDLYRVGVVAKIQQMLHLPNDTVRVLVTALERMEIDTYVSINPYFEVNLMPIKEPEDDPVALSAIKGAIHRQVDVLVKLESKIPKDAINLMLGDDDEKIIATAGTFIFINDTDRQKLLETVSMYDRMELIYTQLISTCQILQIEKRIAGKVRDSIDKNQKEYYLREQIKAIHEELGDDDDEMTAFRTKAKKSKMPQDAVNKMEKELSRMSKMAPQSPEAGVIRTYVEWLTDLPWSEKSKENLDLVKAKQILDEDHFGLEKVKERIVEYLAVHQLTQNLKAPILCFVGPPGVGKTSIVSSIARASNRKLVQMSLGGVRDEAEIRGHRRTYIGAMPGRILTGMKNSGVVNPVFLLDEIDKMSSDFRGDPASAMLEVLDPNQNNAFLDHYLEIPYDLSNTMFVCTANSIENIPSPLLDRMEVIELSGYTYEEKLQIAKRYLLPKQILSNGLKEENITINDDVLMDIISLYTRESGVRNLERQIGTIIRKIAVKIVNDKDLDKKYDVSSADLLEYLGAIKYKKEDTHSDSVGLVTGLAWTQVGGVTLDVEVALIPHGKGELTLTGNMGDVMKESAKTAYTLIRSRSEKYNIDNKYFTDYDLHIHIPEGATPKDGPSAGVTLSTAIYSVLTNKKVKSSVAMTGEITLLGNVLAIGGLKEKSLAAFRHGIKTLIVPEQNSSDIQYLPQEVKDNLTIITAKQIDDVLSNAIV